jgi:hypothetical protein
VVASFACGLHSLLQRVFSCRTDIVVGMHVCGSPLLTWSIHASINESITALPVLQGFEAASAGLLPLANSYDLSMLLWAQHQWGWRPGRKVRSLTETGWLCVCGGGGHVGMH